MMVSDNTQAPGMRFGGKIAIVTGAASGIGRATALAFAREGARVACADINGEGAEETAQAIAAAGGEAMAIRADVASEPDVQRMVAETARRWDGLDILFNNAGVGLGAPITGMTLAQWQRVLDVNLTGVFLGCKYAIPEMLKRGGGVIVNTASDAGLRGSPYLSAYCASKAGVILLTKSLAVEWAAQGIRINCVCPGLVRTPIVEPYLKQMQELTGAAPQETWERLARSHPIGRVGEPEDVAQAVLFLASPQAAFITGVALPVDGGMEAGPPPRP